jgi:CHAT domain-containing protein
VQLAALQSILASDQQALVFYFAGSEILAFVVGKKETQVVRRLAKVEEISQAQAALRFQMGRAELDSGTYVARFKDRRLQGVQDALYKLYQLLIAPLQELLTTERLLVIPFGLLHLIPFHALWDGTGYCLEHKEFAYVPSASIAVHKQRESNKRNGGDAPLRSFSGLAPFDERIPQAQAEIETAAAYFERSLLYCGDEATIANLASSAGDVLHLATHGLFRPDNSFFSALKLADGWLDVREIYRLKLAAKLVVLSACESGVGDVRAGDEVVGLARGFLAAGAQQIIASLWNVHDQSAARLMDFLYSNLQGVPLAGAGDAICKPMRPAAALRAAQLDALRRGDHPYFWASFFAIG